MRDIDIITARTNQPPFPPPLCLAAALWRRALGAQCIPCMLANAHKQLNTAPFPARRGKGASGTLTCELAEAHPRGMAQHPLASMQ